MRERFFEFKRQRPLPCGRGSLFNFCAHSEPPVLTEALRVWSANGATLFLIVLLAEGFGGGCDWISQLGCCAFGAPKAQRLAPCCSSHGTAFRAPLWRGAEVIAAMGAEARPRSIEARATPMHGPGQRQER